MTPIATTQNQRSLNNTESSDSTRLEIMETLSELLRFLGKKKKLWLLPLVIVMLIVGALLAFAQGSVLAPFIYTVF